MDRLPEEPRRGHAAIAAAIAAARDERARLERKDAPEDHALDDTAPRERVEPPQER